MKSKLYGELGKSGMFYEKPHKVPPSYILMTGDRPTINHVAQADGTWVLSQEKLDELYASDLTTLDPLLSHIYRHDFNGEVDAKARAELQYAIAQAEVMEKYDRGSTVWITENGECYHADEECTHIGLDDNNEEINLSDGLKNYTACSYCVTN